MDNENMSTYSATFAGIFILIIIVFIAYNSLENVYKEREEYMKNKNKELVVKNINIESVPDGEVLFENLSNEEVEEIINKILNSNDTNSKQIKKLEEEILN